MTASEIKALKAENKQLKQALKAILESWDDNLRGDREQFKGTWIGAAYVEYWSPAAALVNSEMIAAARKILKP